MFTGFQIQTAYIMIGENMQRSGNILKSKINWPRVYVWFLIALLLLASLFFVFLIKNKERNFKLALRSETSEVAPSAKEPFPVGVDPSRKLIVERPEVDSYLSKNLAYRMERPERKKFFGRLLASLYKQGWYQSLASSGSRVLVIYPGERKEEVAQNFAKILGWSKGDKEAFSLLVSETAPTLPDGKFFPERYVVNSNSTPGTVASLILEKFKGEISSRYPAKTEAVVPLSHTLVIASLLEREAYDFTDMRIISGIIWNRLFIDMPLQIDATLQYVNGTQSATAWWPKVRTRDKFLDSPFNTYQNEGLPPSPIANPSLDAILAALNPAKTDCLFYFHDDEQVFHCSQTYEEHVAKLKEIYGRGK
jgi:cell division protein YceG involved in septum cleavage